MTQKQNQTNEDNIQDSIELSLKKEKIKLKKEKNYFVWKDTSFIWTMIILLLCFLMTISFLNVKGLTTIHSYTINIFFGMFSILFYVWIMLFAFKKLFNLKNTYSAKIFHFSLWRLAIFFFAILIFGSVIYFTANKVFPTAGKSYKIVFDNWFETFSSSHNAVLPYKWNAGIIGSFIYSFFTLLGKTAGIVFSFSLSILILVASILIFFISDIRFNLISFSKAKRDEARKILFNKKNSNLKVKTVYQTPKISQNVAKTESKIEDQLESDIAIKTNATNKNNEDIHLKHSNEIETKSPDLVAAQITKNAMLDSKNEVKEIPQVLNTNKKYKTIIMDNGIAQIVTDEQKLDVIQTQVIKPEINNKNETNPSVETIDFDDNPFYTSTIEIVDPQKTQEMEAIKTKEDENLEKTAETYISKSIEPKELKNYEKEITQEIPLEEQEIEITKENDFTTVSKTKTIEQPTLEKKKRYSIIDDEEDMF